MAISSHHAPQPPHHQKSILAPPKKSIRNQKKSIRNQEKKINVREADDGSGRQNKTLKMEGKRESLL